MTLTDAARMVTTNRATVSTDRMSYTTDAAISPAHDQQWRAITHLWFPADFEFLDGAWHGWYVKRVHHGRSFVVIRTADDGRSWRSSRAFGRSFAYDGVTAGFSFINARHGWLAVQTASQGPGIGASVFATSDGGASWRPLGYNPLLEPSIEFTSPRDGWAIGNGDWGRLFHTSDGGSHWHQVPLPSPPPSLGHGPHDMAVPTFVDPMHGFIATQASTTCCDHAIYYSTSDGGVRWKVQAGPAGQVRNFASSFLSPTLWYATFGQHLLRTDDAGRHWRVVPTAFKFLNTTDLSFADPEVGILRRVGVGFFLTTDGGHTWEFQRLPR